MQINSGSVNQTLKLGKIVARHLGKGDILCLFGELGSGKTVLTKGIACGLGLAKDKITSPTFVIIREYRGLRLPLFHFDLYRIKSPQDILALGYEEYLEDGGVTVIEWADRLGYLLPPEYLKIELSVKSDCQRLLKFFARGKNYQELLDKIDEDIRD